MFGRKKTNDFEMTIKKFNKAYNNMNEVLDKKTKELDKIIEQEKKTQNELFAIMDYQMDILKAHI